MYALPSSELGSSLGDIDAFHGDLPAKPAKSDGSAATDQQTQQCFDDLFKTATAVGKGERLVMEIKGDFGDCLNKALSADPKAAELVHFYAADLHFYWEVDCQGADFSTSTGKSPFAAFGSKEFADTFAACDNSPLVTMRSNSDAQLDMDLYLFGKSRLKVRSISSTTKADGSPCSVKRNGDDLVHGDCLFLDKSTTDGKIANPFASVGAGTDTATASSTTKTTEPDHKVELKKVTYTDGVTIAKGAEFFKSAAIAFIVDNWSGTMTYSADGVAAPTWSAKAGTDAKTGTLSVSQD